MGIMSNPSWFNQPNLKYAAGIKINETRSQRQTDTEDAVSMFAFFFRLHFNCISAEFKNVVFFFSFAMFTHVCYIIKIRAASLIYILYLNITGVHRADLKHKAHTLYPD